jgi:hypothetical protein
MQMLQKMESKNNLAYLSKAIIPLKHLVNANTLFYHW